MVSNKVLLQSRVIPIKSKRKRFKQIGWPNSLELERFYAKIQYLKNGCWKWVGAKNTDGYGYFKFRGKQYRSVRLAHQWIKGEIPIGLIVCHACDNPSCVNPDHLFCGTFKENTQDMIRKGRNAKGYSRPNQVGSNNIKSKLQKKQVLAIRKAFKSGDRKFGAGALARKYGTSDVAILNIITRKCWKHI